MPDVGAADAYRLAQRVRDKGFSVLVGRDFHTFGRASVVQPPLRLAGEDQIAVGAGVFVGAGSWLQVIGAAGDGPRLRIGDGTSMSGTCVLSAVERITIGRRVLFARNVYVADHTHGTGDPGRAILDQGVDGVAPVEIGDGAWLGQNVVVLPGVRIGRGAVVGAGSVVRTDVPDLAVAVGAPARVVGDVRGPRRLAGGGAS
jgi:lipopolysaccharide O-acetyltransferase